MRRALPIAVALALLAPDSAPGGVHRTSVGVGMREYRISLYRDRVRPGLIKLNIQNFGEDPHDLVIRTLSGRVVARAATVPAASRDTFVARLRRPGRFVVFCSLADHEQRGMRVRLTVSRRAPA